MGKKEPLFQFHSIPFQIFHYDEWGSQEGIRSEIGHLVSRARVCMQSFVHVLT